MGVEPTRLAAGDFKSLASAIPPPGLWVAERDGILARYFNVRATVQTPRPYYSSPSHDNVTVKRRGGSPPTVRALTFGPPSPAWCGPWLSKPQGCRRQGLHPSLVQNVVPSLSPAATAGGRPMARDARLTRGSEGPWAGTARALRASIVGKAWSHLGRTPQWPVDMPWPGTLAGQAGARLIMPESRCLDHMDWKPGSSMNPRTPDIVGCA